MISLLVSSRVTFKSSMSFFICSRVRLDRFILLRCSVKLDLLALDRRAARRGGHGCPRPFSQLQLGLVPVLALKDELDVLLSQGQLSGKGLELICLLPFFHILVVYLLQGNRKAWTGTPPQPCPPSALPLGAAESVPASGYTYALSLACPSAPRCSQHCFYSALINLDCFT